MRCELRSSEDVNLEESETLGESDRAAVSEPQHYLTVPAPAATEGKGERTCFSARQQHWQR